MVPIRTRAVAAFAAALLVLAACTKGTPAPSPHTAGSPPAQAPSESEQQGSASATEKDFAISLGATTIAPGETTFNVTNDGPSVHEFVVLKTADDPGALPVDNKGDVDEEAPGVENVGEVEDVGPGETKDFTIRVQPGQYVVICNLPGHYKRGMYAGITVS